MCFVEYDLKLLYIVVVFVGDLLKGLLIFFILELLFFMGLVYNFRVELKCFVFFVVNLWFLSFCI